LWFARFGKRLVKGTESELLELTPVVGGTFEGLCGDRWSGDVVRERSEDRDVLRVLEHVMSPSLRVSCHAATCLVVGGERSAS